MDCERVTGLNVSEPIVASKIRAPKAEPALFRRIGSEDLREAGHCECAASERRKGRSPERKPKGLLTFSSTYDLVG